ncbi:MAG: CbiQ family ECF transporter T component [Microthrixaceae bacterium]
MAAGATRTTNLALLSLILAVVSLVVASRRGAAPWARGFKYYLYLALFVVGIRVLFRVLLDAGVGTTELFTLPELPLPDAAAGIRLGGRVTAEALLGALREGLRLATMIICIGSANVLANPKRLLASVPGALHEIAVAVTVALSVAPQLVTSAQRINAARQLRGDTARRAHLLRDIVVPVATDALDRSLMLAAAMDSRGHGRMRATTDATARPIQVLVVVGLGCLAVGTYATLDAGIGWFVGIGLLVVGAAFAAGALVLSGRRVVTTRYRPDPWSWAEWSVGACGVVVAGALFWLVGVDPLGVNPAPSQIGWPSTPLFAICAVLVGALPAVLAPPLPAELGGFGAATSRRAMRPGVGR